MTADDWFERYERESPEHKLELIEGRLVVGGRLSMTLRFVKSVQAELHVPCSCSAIFGIPSGDKTVS